MSNTLISQIDAIFEEANTTARNQVLELVAKSLAAQTDLFKKKMSAKQILALLMADGGDTKKKTTKKAAKADDSDAASDEAADDEAGGDDDEAGDDEAATGESSPTSMPEGWDEKKVKAFWKAYNKMENGYYLNAISNRSNDGKKKTGLVRNDKWHLCAKTDEKEILDAIVAYLNANPEPPVAKRGRKATPKTAAKKGGKKAATKDSDDDEEAADASDEAAADDDEEETPKAAKKGGKKAAPKDSDDDEADDEEGDDAEYVDGYDAALLEKLKTAVGKAEKGTFVNVATRKIVSKNEKNEKKFKFVSNKKLAIPILADDDEMTAYEARLYAMLK